MNHILSHQINFAFAQGLRPINRQKFETDKISEETKILQTNLDEKSSPFPSSTRCIQRLLQETRKDTLSYSVLIIYTHLASCNTDFTLDKARQQWQSQAPTSYPRKFLHIYLDPKRQ